MASNEQILEHLIEMKEDVASIKATLIDWPALKAEVIKHDREILKAKTSLKVLRWMIGVVVSVPSIAYAISKFLER